VPKYCVLPNGETQAAFGLEVHLYACPIGESTMPRPEIPGMLPARWFALEEVSKLPLWPKEIKALASALASGKIPYGVPSFVSKLESPWEVPIEALLFNVPAIS
jgi:phosphatase NudJ